MALIWELAIGQTSAQHGHNLGGMRQPGCLQRGVVVVEYGYVHHGGRHAGPADVSGPQLFGRRVRLDLPIGQPHGDAGFIKSRLGPRHDRSLVRVAHS